MAVNTVLTVSLLCLGVLQIKAFSTGAPEGVCDDLTPQHNTEAQKTPFPYTIKVSKPNIRPGDTVQVTITGKKGSTFKGFIIQARDGDKAFGSFDEAGKAKIINCHNGKKNAATHTDADPKRAIELTWTAPAKISGKTTFVFTATVARDGGTYWVAQKGAQVTVTP